MKYLPYICSIEIKEITTLKKYIMKTTKLTIEQKGNLMNEIIGSLKTQAFILERDFDGAKMFFDLLYKTDKELLNIHRLCKK